MSEGQETSSQQNIISWVRCQFFKTEGRSWTMIQDLYRWIADFCFFFFFESISVAYSLPKGLMLLKSTFWKGIATALKCSNFDLGRYLEAFCESFSIQENKYQSPRSPSHVPSCVLFRGLANHGNSHGGKSEEDARRQFKVRASRRKPTWDFPSEAIRWTFFGHLWILYIFFKIELASQVVANVTS